MILVTIAAVIASLFSLYALRELFLNSRVWLVMLASVLDFAVLVCLQYLQQIVS